MNVTPFSLLMCLITNPGVWFHLHVQYVVSRGVFMFLICARTGMEEEILRSLTVQIYDTGAFL